MEIDMEIQIQMVTMTVCSAGHQVEGLSSMYFG